MGSFRDPTPGVIGQQKKAAAHARGPRRRRHLSRGKDESRPRELMGSGQNQGVGAKPVLQGSGDGGWGWGGGEGIKIKRFLLGFKG